MVAISGPLQLLQSWIFWRFSSLKPYGFDYFRWPLATRWERYLPTSDEKDPRVLQYRTKIDRLTHRDFVCCPYMTPEVAYIADRDIWREENRRLWTSVCTLIYFGTIEWHQVDRVIPQFSGMQNYPHRPLNIDWLHARDGRGGDRWFPTTYQSWHGRWGADPPELASESATSTKSSVVRTSGNCLRQ
ncbi:hypothetical protein PIB30_090078 [Stylosanthes scabra]|uniref:Aminotransferase-like plant mobile domain-containing protein n=1 Tax=Stylosanthes scabra TaxID=79078 RepID=A0ABU6TWD8_9FABA|nr:hypothetical protein [Stylosanthes scabra]